MDIIEHFENILNEFREDPSDQKHADPDVLELLIAKLEEYQEDVDSLGRQKAAAADREDWADFELFDIYLSNKLFQIENIQSRIEKLQSPPQDKRDLEQWN